VIFCLHRTELVLLHGFIKKTPKTAPQEIDLAWKRMKGLKA
jgi:phage-related protein